ncbi:MAG: ATP-binding protein [Bacteroidales bacterium]|nr:ATP-binding protein [Bacteroidales bacterium]
MNKTLKIVLTGPESTGKTTLAEKLANHYSLAWTKELAREFVENLNRPYIEKDVLEIAKLQILEENKILNKNHKAVFFDTDLIITKIWLLHVYGKSPNWIDEEIRKNKNCIHLLCYPDLPWLADAVRENSNNRLYLFEKYETEIINYGFPYKIIKGNEKERFETAIEFLNLKILGNRGSV